jgi:predicted ABC-type ATPase
MKKANEKILYIIGGVNGAGKSTFAENAMANSKYTCLNPDSMAFNISRNYSSTSNLSAGRQVIEILRSNAESGKPIIWETILGSKTHEKICQLYKDKGYLIDLTYIFLLDKSTHFERIAERVANGGHNIDHKALTQRFKSRVNNFDSASKTADTWRMLCNQNPWFELVAFGHGEAKMISNHELYKSFYNSALGEDNFTPIEKFKKFSGFSVKTQ